MGFSTTHLLIFLVIVVLVFGTKKLKNMGSDLGSAVKGFKDGVKGASAEAAENQAEQSVSEKIGATMAAQKAQETIDVEAKTKV